MCSFQLLNSQVVIGINLAHFLILKKYFVISFFPIVIFLSYFGSGELLNANVFTDFQLAHYTDETVEEDVIEEIKEQVIEEPIKKPVESTNVSGGSANPNPTSSNRLSFNNIDYVKTADGNEVSVQAPKDIQRLEEISQIRYQQRKAEEEEDDNEKLKISDQPFNLDVLDVHNIEEPKMELLPDLLIDDIEVLE